MSADSLKRLSKIGTTTVRPQPYSDKSVVESVVDFFQDVAYKQNAPKTEEKEKIQWVRFENADINDLNNNPDCVSESAATAPLLMLIGYNNGVQMWTVAGNGEGQEVLSLRQGPVRTLRVLPTPLQDSGQEDKFKNMRPLIALVDASSAGQPYCSVKFVSLRSGDEVHSLPFSYQVLDIECNSRVLVVSFKENLAVFDAVQYKQMFWVTSCYPGTGPNVNPMSLGDRWLAYAEKKLVPVHQSGGGVSGDCGQSYAATVISAAKTVTKGLTMFGQTVASSLTGSKQGPLKKEAQSGVTDTRYRPGIVTVVDVLKVKESQLSVRDDMDGEGLVAHFPAHPTEPVSALQFDPSGMMLLTTDKLGHNFHLFRIMAHPLSCSQGAVHHLYTLYRGDTTAKVQDITFTSDSRWVAVSSLRGTTHIFPITPYGGSVNVRTHTSSRVVNRASRFHRSAGLEDMPPGQSGRDSPVPGSASPSSSPRQSEHYRHLNALNNLHTSTNPRLPPFPHPTTVTALVHIRQKVAIPGLGGGSGSGAGKSDRGQARQQAPQLDNVCVAARFAKSRGWVAGSPGFSTRDKDKPRAVDSLYILSWTGILVEHVLDPHSKINQDKVTDDSPLEVDEIPRAQWMLGRTSRKPELRPPLPSGNPLIEACDAVLTQKQTEGLSRQESKESLSSDGSNQEFYQQWVSQVEINTHAGPHRRLWMGPQFSFKTFQGSAATVLSAHSSVLLSHSPEQHVSTMDIVKDDVDLHSLEISPTRSSPVAMPPSSQGRRSTGRHTSGSERQCPSPGLQTFIEAGSYDHSPTSGEPNCEWPEAQLPSGEVGDSDLLQQSLADAMSEVPSKDTRTHPASIEIDAGPASFDNLSTSSGSASSAPRIMTFDARSSPHQCFDHVLVFPNSNDSTDASQ